MPLLAFAVSIGVGLMNDIDTPRREPWYPAGAGELQPAVDAVLGAPARPGGLAATAALYLVHLACPAMFVLLWVLQRQERHAATRAEDTA